MTRLPESGSRCILHLSLDATNLLISLSITCTYLTISYGCFYLLLSRKRVMTTCIVCPHSLLVVDTNFGGRPDVCKTSTIHMNSRIAPAKKVEQGTNHR